MKIEKVEIKNFRLLKNLVLDLESDLSVVVGKNNAGKTSFLAILEKFLSKNDSSFSFDDFSITEQKRLCSIIDCDLSPADYSAISLSLKIYISYSNEDTISDASEFLLDLDESNTHFVLLFEYALSYEKFVKLKDDYNTYVANGISRPVADFVSKNIKRYFSQHYSALEYGNEENLKEITLESIRKVISLETISARRDVDNDQGHSKSLSALAYRYYNNIGSATDFPDLQKQLLDTDGKLTEIYKDIFKDVVKEIQEMSYNPHEAEISVVSSLIDRPIFQDNTVVKYMHEDTLLPEDYNGLGYLNLFAIMFDLRIKLDRLSKKNRPDEHPTPINILFIEEPEAHTHPQMQYVFITNIKGILKNQIASVEGFNLQTILSTHSAHIVSQCDFQDIKYFYRVDSVDNSVQSKSLKTLFSTMVTASDSPDASEEEKSERASQEKAFRFVKQYVTLNRSELFFADKAILIEGDTERMLMSAMMKKQDDGEAGNESYVPLLSQNISVIEVGAYSHVFATFLAFIGIKTLIFTDLDCAKRNENGRYAKCPYTEAEQTTNASIKYFLNPESIQNLTAMCLENRVLKCVKEEETVRWEANTEGQLLVMFQCEEYDYQPSSFEDAFLSCNMSFVSDNKDGFCGLKNLSLLMPDSTDYYVLANKCIDSKTTFALDVLMNGGVNNEKWNTPLYIKEGLKWLAQ
jgi:predicted ATP-dependent endonuclease of OLD family